MQNSLFLKKPESAEQYFDNKDEQRPGGSGSWSTHVYKHIECKPIIDANTVTSLFRTYLVE